MTSELKTKEEATPAPSVAIHSGRLYVLSLSTHTRTEAPRIERDIPVPYRVIERYAHEAIRQAAVEQLEDGNGLYASIPGFIGVWASADNYADLLTELEHTVREWTVLKLTDHDHDLPVVGDIDLRWASQG